MSYQKIRFSYVSGAGTVRSLVWPNVTVGTTGTAVQVRVQNVSSAPAVTLTSLRVFCKLVSGGFTGGLELGSEAMSERWFEVRLLPAGAWKPVGGPFGGGDPAANYLDLPNLAPGASVDIEIRPSVPATPDTQRRAQVRLGVAYIEQ